MEIRLTLEEAARWAGEIVPFAEGAARAGLESVLAERRWSASHHAAHASVARQPRHAG
jgi:hypothetical protein